MRTRNDSDTVIPSTIMITAWVREAHMKTPNTATAMPTT